jgi:hypothetical protein
MAPSPDERPKRGGERGDWASLSYRTIYSVTGLVIVVVAVVAWFILRTPTPAPTTSPKTTVESAVIARFTSLAGSVKVRQGGAPEWRDASAETLLRKGDFVRTARDSAAQVTFFDGSVMDLRPECVIEIEEASQNPKTQRPSVVSTVSLGTVNLSARSSTEVITPNFTVRQEPDSTGAIHVGTTGESQVSIFRGTGSVKTKGGQEVALGTNEQVRVSSAGQASEKVVLPSAPRLVAPVDESDLVYANPAAAATTLQWSEVKEAASYRIMVDSNPQFYRPIVDQVHERTSVRLRGLDVGKYYWRVAAVGKGQAEGSFSEPGRFGVSRGAATAAASGPQLSITMFEVRGNLLQVKGKTEAGASVAVNGEPVQVQPDGTFNEYIGLERAGRQDVKIRVVGLNGGIREDTRSVVVAF